MNKSTLMGVVGGLVVGVLIGTFALQSGGDQQEAGGQSEVTSKQEVVNWSMPSSFPATMLIGGTGGKDFEENVRAISNGTLNIRFFDPNALVPPLEIFDAVSVGAANTGWSSSGYWAGKVPALQFFAAVPFGPGASEYLAWIYHGGGLELMQEIYARYNIVSQPCAMSPPEGSGWFRFEVKSVDELKGLKMRFFGLGAKVMEKIGVSTQLIAGGDIFPALELGTIDATEFAMPYMDLELGFHEVAKHYYFPGWHQPTSMNEFMVNQDDWDTLSDAHKEIINTVCKANMLRTLALGDAVQFGALEEIQAKGVTLHRWPQETLDVLESAWHEVVEEMASEDEDFARVWASLKSFREEYKVWGDLGYLD
jgi:TRAP-type mannitol/chloroaromatic compound transport system substrate-binding protein